MLPWRSYLNVTMTRGGDGKLAVALTLTTHGKQPTMIGEATSLSFTPAPALVPLSDTTSAWTIDKLGGAVDPEGINDGGNQYCHGTWNGVTAKTTSGTYVAPAPSVNASVSVNIVQHCAYPLI